MNKLWDLYGIALDSPSAKIEFAVGAVYPTTSLSWIVETESCYQFCQFYNYTKNQGYINHYVEIIGRV